MGYYSVMHRGDFRSNLSLKELQGKLARPRKDKRFSEISDDVVLSEQYSIQEIELPKNDSGRFEIIPKDEDFCGKHYNHEELAQYLSEVIVPGEHAHLEFDGEDGNKWGWLIFAGEVKPVEYIATVDGIFLDEYIAGREIENTTERR